jgi:glycosyltransferase involved in cell wall biosynthesis
MTAEFAQILVNPVQCNISDSLLWGPAGAHSDTLLFVGRFDAHKGGDIVLLAFKRILAARADAQLIFVGPNSGSVEEGGMLYAMDAYLTKHFSASEREHITLTGPLKAAEIGRLRVQAAVTIIASRWENQPNTVLEAMVQGCPVVATNTAGIPEVITHEVDGLLCRNADPDAMAGACLRLMTDPQFSLQLGSAARRNSVARHHPLIVARSNVNFYERVLAAARSRRPVR